MKKALRQGKPLTNGLTLMHAAMHRSRSTRNETPEPARKNTQRFAEDKD